MRNPIIAALDVPDVETALKLAAQIAPGGRGASRSASELFIAAGPDIVRRDSRHRRGGVSRFEISRHPQHGRQGRRRRGATRRANAHHPCQRRQRDDARGGKIRARHGEIARSATAAGPRRDRADEYEQQTHWRKLVVKRMSATRWSGSRSWRLNSGLRGLVCSPLEIAACEKFFRRRFNW